MDKETAEIYKAREERACESKEEVREILMEQIRRINELSKNAYDHQLCEYITALKDLITAFESVSSIY